MAVRSVIGVTGQFSATDAYLSAEENLLLMADLSHLTEQHGRERSAELIRLFDLVAVLDDGEIVAQGTAAELKRRIPGGHALLTFTSASALDAAATQFGDCASRNDADLTLQVASDDSGRSVQEVLSRIDVDSVRHVTLHTPDLDDVFLARTGRARKAQP